MPSQLIIADMVDGYGGSTENESFKPSRCVY